MAFRQAEWRYTTRPGKLYITFFVEPRGPFEQPAMKNTVTRAYYLGGDRGAAPVRVRKDNGRTFLDIDRPVPEPMASVVVVEHDGGRIEAIK